MPFYVSERNCSEKETAQRVLPDAKRPLKTSELYETPQCSVISHVFQIAPWKMPDAQYSCGTERRCCTSQASLRAHAHVHSQQACSHNVLLALRFFTLSCHECFLSKELIYNVQPPYVSGSMLPEWPRGRSHPHLHADE